MNILTVSSGLISHLLNPETWACSYFREPVFNRPLYIIEKFVDFEMRKEFGNDWRDEKIEDDYEAQSYEDDFRQHCASQYDRIREVVHLFSVVGVPPYSLSTFTRLCYSCSLYGNREYPEAANRLYTTLEAYEILKAAYNGECCGICDNCPNIDHDDKISRAVDVGFSISGAIELAKTAGDVRLKRRI